MSVQAENGGTITGDAPGSYKAGTAITLKAVPDSNYSFAGWDATGITLTSKQKNNAVLSFTMPKEPVTVTAGFQKEGAPTYALSDQANSGGKTVITGLPDAYTLLVGQNVSWTPAPAGGAWSYDKDSLQMTQEGGTYTFKALKAGKATATYTVGGVPYAINITINTNTIPQTGDTSNPLPLLLLAMAALLGCCLLAVEKRSKRG